MNASPYLQLGVALGLGLLVGMQRERTERSVAGVRTFPLITMFGAVAALLAQAFGGWVLAAGMIALAGLVVTGNLAKQKAGDLDPGTTTEFAAVLMFAVGALTMHDLSLAVLVGGLAALLLHLKAEMHRIVGAFGEREVRAIMQFVLLTLVILPVLPNQVYGPYAVLNPFKLWLMVVLIVGLSLCGYVAFKLFGAKRGTLVAGLLGGLISSTATTVSFARHSQQGKDGVPLFATIILLASTVVYARVLALLGAVAAPLFTQLAPPLAVMLGVMIVLSVVTFFASRQRTTTPIEPENPAELKSALIFGGLYAVVLILVAAANQHFGQAGIYVVAVISGLTDMDAITLSTSQLAAGQQLAASTAWRAVLLASLANMVFKLGVIAAIGTRGLLLRVGAAFAVALVAGGAILWWWPW